MKKSWLVPFGVIFLIFTAYMSLKSGRDGDMYFMIANGEYILKHGFPYENPFVMHEGFKIVIQQWIPSVLAYLGYKTIGWEFFRIEAVLGMGLLDFAIYKLISLNQPKDKSFLVASILTASMLYLNVGKPMLYSIILLVWQMYLCEKKESWLWFPLIVLIEANIHSSFIAFHFVYLLPYIVPGVTKQLNNKANYKYIKAIPVMAIAALINPYGLDGALYLFKSFNDKLNQIPIQELQPISITNESGAAAALCLAFVIVQLIRIYIKPHKSIDSDRFYLFAGSLLLLIIYPQMRNYIFLVIGSVPLIATMLPGDTKKKTPPAKAMWAVAICCIMAVTANIPSISLNYRPQKCAEYLQDKEYVLYNGMNTGAYLEMQGVKVFIDARPELFTTEINGKADVVNDFMEIAFDAPENCIEKYGFTHFCVGKDSTMYNYLKERGYQIVAEDEEYVLFQI